MQRFLTILLYSLLLLAVLATGAFILIFLFVAIVFNDVGYSFDFFVAHIGIPAALVMAVVLGLAWLSAFLWRRGRWRGLSYLIALALYAPAIWLAITYLSASGLFSGG